MRTLILASALGLILASTASAQSAKLNPCGLVTTAEIKAAVGIEPTKPSLNTSYGSSAGALCDFQVGEAGLGGVAIEAMPAGETPQTIASKTAALKIKVSPATGYGPGAFFTVADLGVVQLCAFKGSMQVIVQLMLPTQPEAKVKEMVGKLMTSVLPRVK